MCIMLLRKVRTQPQGQAVWNPIRKYKSPNRDDLQYARVEVCACEILGSQSGMVESSSLLGRDSASTGEYKIFQKS